MLRSSVSSEPSEISLLWWLWSIRGARDVRTAFSVTNGSQVGSRFMLLEFEV